MLLVGERRRTATRIDAAAIVWRSHAFAVRATGEWRSAIKPRDDVDCSQPKSKARVRRGGRRGQRFLGASTANPALGGIQRHPYRNQERPSNGQTN
jgi:hypothetical protein